MVTDKLRWVPVQSSTAQVPMCVRWRVALGSARQSSPGGCGVGVSVELYGGVKLMGAT